MSGIASRYLVCHALTPAQHAQAVAVGVPELSTIRGKLKPGPADELVIVTRAPWAAVNDLEITRNAWKTAGARVHIVPLSEWLARPVTRPAPRPAPVVVDLGALTVEFEPTPSPPPKPQPVIVEGPPITAERLPEQFPYPGTFRTTRSALYRYDVAELEGWATGRGRHPGDCAICGGHVSGYGQVRGRDAAHANCLRTARSDLAAIPQLLAGLGCASRQQQANRLVLGGRLRWYRVGRRVVLALPEWGAR